MNIAICLDREDIKTCKFGNNYAITVDGNPNIQIILTSSAFDELVADVNDIRKSENPSE